jgi:hypothetical protein
VQKIILEVVLPKGLLALSAFTATPALTFWNITLAP